MESTGRGSLSPPLPPPGLHNGHKGPPGRALLRALFVSRRLEDDFKTTRRRQDDGKTIRRRLERLQDGFKRAQDRILTPTWPNLGASWTPWGRPNPVKTNCFCMFLLLHPFASQDAQDAPKTAPRAPQEAPRRPQEAPRASQDPPRGPQDDPKTAPRRLRDASKTLSKTTLC